jgi:hypothetical protein
MAAPGERAHRLAALGRIDPRRLLERAFVESDGTWVPSTAPEYAAIRDRVLEAIAVQGGGALLADQLYTDIAGTDDDESLSELTLRGPCSARGPFSVDVAAAVESRGAWTSLHPQIAVTGSGGRSGHLLFAADGVGSLTGEPESGELSGSFRFAYVGENTEARGAYARGTLTVTITSSVSSRESRGPVITGLAEMELTLDGWTNCADGTCPTGYTTSVTGPYTLVLSGDEVRFELPRLGEPFVLGEPGGGTTFEVHLRFVAPVS